MPHRRSRARDELLAWARARDFRDRAIEYLNRAAPLSSDGDVQRRFIAIARHYRLLAQAEADKAERLGMHVVASSLSEVTALFALFGGKRPNKVVLLFLELHSSQALAMSLLI